MNNQTEEAETEHSALEHGYVHLFDSLMTICSTAKALTEEVLQLANDGDGGGENNGGNGSFGISAKP